MPIHEWKISHEVGFDLIIYCLKIWKIQQVDIFSWMSHIQMLFHRHVVIAWRCVPQPGISYPETLHPLLFDDAAFIYNHYNRNDRTCCIMLKSICTVHFKSIYSSFLLILELKSINLAYCAIVQTSWILLMVNLDLIHVIKISFKKSSPKERDDCIFFQWNFTVRTTFCYIQWYNDCWLLDYYTFHRLIILSIYFIYPSC